MLERGAVVLEPKNALKLAALEAGEAPSMEGLSGKAPWLAMDRRS